MVKGPHQKRCTENIKKLSPAFYFVNIGDSIQSNILKLLCFSARVLFIYSFCLICGLLLISLFGIWNLNLSGVRLNLPKVWFVPV